ncbi:MAG: type II secretion system secretin GspD [Burkholderiaceae bacterium]|nr:type II secretion system secretin GspD [Burkholderiaceae bacterium]
MNVHPPVFSLSRWLRRHASRLGAGTACLPLTLSLAVSPLATLPLSVRAQVAAGEAAANRFRGDPVTLNFVNADIEAVSRAMAAILRQQFIVDPRVKGTMTLYSEQALSPREAYLNYLAALRGLGFTVVEVGGLFKVVPEADAKLQSGTVSVGDVNRRGDQVITQIYRLTHENANNLVPVLRPLISPNNTINANPGNNTLVITDYADNLQRIAKIIAAMDTPAAGDVEVITLRHAVASDIAVLVQRLTETTAGAAPGTPGSANASVLVDPRSNSLLVRAPNPARLAAIRALVDKLDQPITGSNAAGNIWVVYLKNADAVKLAAVLRAAYAGGSGASSSSGGNSSPLSSPTASAQNPLGGSNTAGASTQATTPVTQSAGPSTGGFVQADPATNSLIITAPEPMYRQLRAMIDQLDSRRAQVFIESMIVEVSGDDSADFGFQWQSIGNSDSKYIGGIGTNFGSGGTNILTNQGATTATGALAGLGPGFNIGVVRNFGGTFGLAAVARALQSRADTNIVSTPNLITLDNEEAKIIVGSNVPFITGQYTNTGNSTTSPFQTIERKDVGITLRIRPQIGENGTVRMTLFQESSSLAAGTAPGTSSAGPTTNKKSIESTVVVDDGQIIVLGGLIEDSITVDKSKVPILGDIPYFGALFRSETRTKKRTNQMVFLRPVVMRDASSSNKLSLDRYDLIRSEQKEVQLPTNPMMPIGTVPVIPPLRPTEDPTQPLTPPANRPPPTGVAPASAPGSGEPTLN